MAKTPPEPQPAPAPAAPPPEPKKRVLAVVSLQDPKGRVTPPGTVVELPAEEAEDLVLRGNGCWPDAPLAEPELAVDPNSLPSGPGSVATSLDPSSETPADAVKP